MSQRSLGPAFTASRWHLMGSILTALLASIMVFLVWYPEPYASLLGGGPLFFLMVSVDVVCGPLLTLVLFNPRKSRRELILDLGLVAVLQLGALGYGLHTMWQVRPLYMVWEIDRFKVISQGELVAAELQALPDALNVAWFESPKTVGIRQPRDAAESTQVLLESAGGGRDYSERPDFYVPLDAVGVERLLKKARTLQQLLDLRLAPTTEAKVLMAQTGTQADDLYVLPIVAKKEWMAVLSVKGQVVGYMPGSLWD